MSNERPKRKHGKISANKSDKESERMLSPAGRPKRRCTSNKKVIIDEFESYAFENNDKDYDPVPDSKETSSTNDSSIIGDQITPEVLKKIENAYKWMDYDEDTTKIRCKTCIRANLRKWFILSGKNVDCLLESMKRHQFSEEHNKAKAQFGEKDSDTQIIRTEPNSGTTTNLPRISPSRPQSSKSPPHFLSKFSPNAGKDCEFKRNVYCLPIDFIDPVPIPDIQMRTLLEKHGLKSTVSFTPTLSPAKLREDISKAFSKTFNLRPQELFSFDYLALSANKNELTKPHKLLHFDGETVLSFVGKKNVYVILRQKAPNVDINWKELLFQEKNLQKLDDSAYKVVMLNVMHRLNSGKHKKNTSSEQRKLVDAMLSAYRLNNYHQLIYSGNGLSQLVLFNERRREEAFTVAHGDHLPIDVTFRRIFKQYYWNNIVDWVTDKVKFCSVCMIKYGDTLADEKLCMMKTIEELNSGEQPDEKPKPKSKTAVTPKEKSKRSDPPNESPGSGEIVLIPDNDIKLESEEETATAPNRHAPQHFSTKPSTHTKKVKQAVVNPVTKVTRSTVTPENVIDLPEKVAVKPEPASGFYESNLLPPVDTGDDLFPDDILQDDGSAERDKALYEEDIEQAIQTNAKNNDERSYCTNTMWAMYLLQQRGTYCDFYIMLLPSAFNSLKKPKIYGVHKVVLSAISKRMRGITKQTIKIGGKITCEDLESVIEFAYTGRLTGIRELELHQIKQIRTTSLALDINVDEYLRKHRPDFVRSTRAKIMVGNSPVE